MAFSLFEEVSMPTVAEEYDLNSYLFHKFDDEHILITVDHGGWVVLNKKEFNLLRYNKINEDSSLKNLLEEKGIIITKRNREKILNGIRDKYEHTCRGTNLHIIVPTLRCNHRCVYCHAKSRGPDEKEYDMDEETAKATVDFIFQTAARAITIEFQGGEPLLNFPIIKFIHKYSQEINRKHKKVIKYIIVTNLTAMTPEIKQYLIKNKIAICTSLDGPKELHDKNRCYLCGKSSYDEVVKKIKELRKDFGFSALPTITKESLKYPKEIINEYVKLGFNGIMSRNLNYAGFAKEMWQKIGYSAEEFLEFWKKSFDYVLELNRKGVYFSDSKIVSILQRILSNRQRDFTCFGAPCGAIVGQLSYDYNGDIRTCDEARSFDIFKLGNVKTHSYKDIILEAKDFIGLTSCVASMCDACVFRPYCGSCVVATWGAQGNVISKLAQDHECKIRGGMLKYIFKKLIFSPEDRKVLLGWYNKRYARKAKNLR